MTLRVHVHGAKGRMGRESCAAIDAAGDLELCGRSGRNDDLRRALRDSRADVLVEFTVPDAAPMHVTAAIDAGVAVVSGTTGIDDRALDRLDARAREHGVGVLVAPNFALGVLLMQRFAGEAARFLHDVEIVELHHERKLDAPSGTARATARRIAGAASAPLNEDRPDGLHEDAGARGMLQDGVPIHSVRLPGLLAHQEVLFGGPGELLTIRHDTNDRRAFMNGVLLAVRQIGDRVGLFRSLEPFLFEST